MSTETQIKFLKWLYSKKLTQWVGYLIFPFVVRGGQFWGRKGICSALKLSYSSFTLPPEEINFCHKGTVYLCGDTCGGISYRSLLDCYKYVRPEDLEYKPYAPTRTLSSVLGVGEEVSLYTHHSRDPKE